MIWLSKSILVFAIALATSFILCPLMRNIALRINFLDYPDKRKLHTEPIALGGGLAVYFSYALALVLTFYYSTALKVLVVSGLVVFLMGLIDDFKGISAIIKFFILVILSIWLGFHGVIIKFSGVYPIDLMVSVLWIVGVTCAFNAIDNMDGLASGIAFIASAMFFIVATLTNQWWFGIISCAMMGATLGFLPYNYHPAKIFLGNAGSFFIGFTIACVAIMGEWSQNRFVAYTIPVFILAIPIFDIIYVVINRKTRGITKTLKEMLAYSGKDHLSHQFLKIGLTQGRTVLLLYALSFSLGIGAIVLRNENLTDAILLFGQLFFIILVILIFLTSEKRIKKDLK